ncbi:MmgE/PrpD family protein [Sphingomonas sp. Y38-1Y]|uniref:MmgE/PrpD family protein n=1 Tax=Sphingomonas sp. Y38-1Y TaxID=3078265 RepID=UPI0028EBD6ED|nr:MmgE/PrpD family protein [Sphingomonas sp. Y38-1Y]
MIDRRHMLIGSAALPIAGAAAQQVKPDAKPGAARHPAAVEGRAVTEPDGTTTQSHVRFAATLRYEDLPAPVVDAARRCMVDALGCGLAGWESNKGRLAADAMARLGGPGEAQLWGGGSRIATTNAAFANAELMNGLDYDAIPHIPPVIVPALMAVAEARKVSGRDFILALVVAYELAARLSSASSPMGAAILETGTTPEVFGINQEAMMAAAAALARMLGLSEAATASAIGLAGYYCPPQASHDWETGSPKSNVKYTPVGWVNQGAVTAALLAESGFTGNPRVLDGPAGFARFYGWSKWDVPAATRGLGEQWRIVNADYKPYACCRYVHSRLDALIGVIERDRIDPATITRIRSWGPPFVANPDQMNVRTQEDAQFSVPYMLALAALKRPIDARCQSPALLADPAVKAMMAKVEWATHPRTAETKRADGRSFIASVEVDAGGRTHAHEVMFAKGNGSVPEARLSDAALDAKFLDNARIRLSPSRAAQLLETLRGLDRAPDMARVGRLMSA